MTPIRILAPALLTFSIVSCASQKADKYDTASPYGPADGGQVNAPVAPVNPVYDTPAAYEESGATAAAATTAGVNAPLAAATPTAPAVKVPGMKAPAVPAAPSNGAAIIHTVVAGDTLSGIASKYKVPAAAIKQANGMTKDTVVLGKKMVIPPVR
ncbi:MAG: LysM peptidoglycan-binding domain-containing protein [Luteolibacter sp.]|uniref:LysM peptidoglycan-binding domain-containing protein n=1 Tax=Luteolibacter sp. TaxID=1962973 RepID=UPI003263738B